MKKLNHIRKSKNIVKLEALGIKCDELVPVLPDSSEIIDKVKSIDEVITRFLSSYLASMGSFIKISLHMCPNETHFANEDLARCINNVKKFELMPYMTDEEKKVFVDINNLCDIGNPLKTEAAYVLGWVLGINKTLHLPNKVCDIFFLDTLLSRVQSLDELKQYIVLKDIETILDELDFEYRISCEIYNQKNVDKSSLVKYNINPDIVWERRFALEWYIGNDVEWDTEEVEG